MNKFNLLLSNSNELLFQAENVRKRINQEESSLERLLKRKDFLSRYNIAIRHMYLHLLKNNFDIKTNKTHFAFLLFCSDCTGFDQMTISKIQKARHALKYKGKWPDVQTIHQLNELIRRLEAIDSHRLFL